MGRELTPQDLRELLGAYALDAVDADERVAIEALVAEDPRARAEVASFREAAALLAQGGGEAPAGVWSRIEAGLEESPPGLVLPFSGRRSRRIIAAVGVAAACAAFVVLGIRTVDQGSRIDELEAAQPRVVTLASPDGSMQAELMYLPDGRGFLLDDNLTPLPSTRTYQLWALVGPDAASTHAVSAAVLGADPGVITFHFRRPVQGFLITEEDAPGVESSSNPPLLSGEVT
jgi:anti-sigma-K factor RskA